MKIKKAIEIKLQWRKDNYPPALADEMNADMISIEAMKLYQKLKLTTFLPPGYKLPGETEE